MRLLEIALLEHPWILTAVPLWMAFMLSVVLAMGLLMFKASSRYHEAVTQTLERVMTAHSTSVRLMFQFIMDRRDAEVDVIVKRLQKVEEKAGITSPLPLPERERAELVKEIKEELAAMNGEKKEAKKS